MNSFPTIPDPAKAVCRAGFSAATFLACLLVPVAVAPAQSVSVTAGNLHGSAHAGSSHVTSKSRPCNGQGITVRSGGGTASSSVSVSSSGGQTAVAGGGSPGSVIERYDCRKPTRHASRRTP